MSFPGSPPLIFSSGHTEERLPLQLVARRVEVRGEGSSTRSPGGAAGGSGAHLGSGARGAASPGGSGAAPVFVCRFHYDHVNMVLGPPKGV